MKTMIVSSDAATGAGLGYSENGDIATFIVPMSNGRNVSVTAKIADDNWQFFPERSSGQKTVMARLGLS